MTTPLPNADSLYRAMIASAPDGIVAIDQANSILLANPAVEGIFGYPAAELIGKPLHTLMPEPHARVHTARLARFLSPGHRHLDWRGVTTTGRHQNGAEIPIEIAFGEAELGGVRVFIAFLRDVTKNFRLQEQLRQSQKLEAVGQLAGGIAHDFNNLLTVILAHSRFLLESLSPGSPEHEDADAILAAGERAASLTRQLLAFSRRQVLVLEELRLGDVVARLEPMLQRLIGEHLVILASTTTSDDLVLADRGQLEQVITNLAINARDAMTSGGTLAIEVEAPPPKLATRMRLNAAEFVLITVSDTGTGMSEDTKRRAFEPFFTTKETGVGTGLGLATVFGIVSQLGGHVAIESTLGEGTAVRVLLPRHHHTSTAAQPPRLTPTQGAPRQQARETTILLVEDESTVRSAARRMLERSGYRVIEARHGGDALLVTAEFGGTIDLLLTDIVMPELNGIELATWFERAFPKGRIVFMSGYTDDDLFRRGLADRSVAFVAKPFTATSLVTVVREALGHV